MRINFASHQKQSAGNRSFPLAVVARFGLLCGGNHGGTLLTAEEPAPKPAAPKPAATKWKPLFDGKTLKNWKSSQFGGEGDIAVKDGRSSCSRVGDDRDRVGRDALPKNNYELRCRTADRRQTISSAD